MIAKALPCGHPKSEMRWIYYRCDVAKAAAELGTPGCRETHVTRRCGVCFDAGDKPSDFGWEFKRTKVR